MNKHARITLHMVSSVDGYIETPDKDVSWMSSPDQFDKGIELTDEAVDDCLRSIDCYLMGSRTYLLALKLGWPYGDTPVKVLTSRQLPREKETVSFYQGNVQQFVHHELDPYFQNVWLVGGAALARSFLQADLIDDIRMTVVPVLLGEGTRFFDSIQQQSALHLKDVTPYKNGMVELWYEVKQNSSRQESSV